MSIPEAATHEERFGLMNWYPDPDNNTHTDGSYDVAKICWALGNYSRFVRPGYERLSTVRSDGLNSIGAADNQLFSAYLADDESELVIVAINYGEASQNLSFTLNDLPAQLAIDSYKAYITNADDDLKVVSDVDLSTPFLMPPKSIITFVGSLNAPIGIIDKELDRGTFQVYPNPSSSVAYVRFTGELAEKIEVLDLTGKTVAHVEVTASTTMIPTDRMQGGTYILAIDFGNWSAFGKLTVVK